MLLGQQWVTLWKKWVNTGDVKLHVPYADGTMKTDNGVNTEEKERRQLRSINHRFPVQC